MNNNQAVPASEKSASVMRRVSGITYENLESDSVRDLSRIKPGDMTDNMAALVNLQHDSVLISFSEVEPEAKLFALIIAQANEDSMPSVIFKSRSKEPLFNSAVPDAYDAYEFMSTDRLDLYANFSGQNPEVIRRMWFKNYKAWLENDAKKVAANIVEHTIKLIVETPENTVVNTDARSFVRSPQIVYWAGILGKSANEIRAYINQSIVDRLKAGNAKKAAVAA